MNLIDAMHFARLDACGLDAYSEEKAAKLDLIISDAYRQSVLENLSALQTHAALLAARLESAEPQPSPMTPP